MQPCVATMACMCPAPDKLLITSAQGTSAKQFDLPKLGDICRAALHVYSRLAMLPLHTNGWI